MVTESGLYMYNSKIEVRRVYVSNQRSPTAMQIAVCWVYTFSKLRMEIRMKLEQQRRLLVLAE